MAIHDIGNGFGRDSPMPNSHDMQDILRKAHGTTSFNPVTDQTVVLSANSGVGYGAPNLIASGDVVVNVPSGHSAGTTYDKTINITIADYDFLSSSPTTSLEVIAFVTTPYADPSGSPRTSMAPYTESSWNSTTSRVEITALAFAYATPTRKAGSTFTNPLALRCLVVPSSDSSMEGNWVFSYYAYLHTFTS